MLVGREQARQSVLLLLGVQVHAGPLRGIKRIACAARVSAELLLDPAPAAVQGIAGQAHDVKGVHDGHGVGGSTAVAVLNQDNPSIATTSTPSTQPWGRSASQDWARRRPRREIFARISAALVVF